ncbi:hypothetical protein GOBAR_AA20443 [Gossypium barbadense]|uniref:Uncharacterized protein n=1 Tax=Gossypium barbadense TaxID=3634 RepID=A0A2P5XA80_GOSBA|nr:hypothetical protein GOBAR_AA20443 [Gossypium barbadense]
MGMGIGERAERLAVRKDYMTLWQTSLMDTMKTDCRFPIAFHLPCGSEHSTTKCQGTNVVRVTCRAAAFMVILAEIACICHLVACLTGNSELEDLAEILTCISDLVYCTVCACMQVWNNFNRVLTQHKLELDHRHSIPWGDPGVMMVPAVQEMSRFDQAVPPTVRQPLGLPPGQLPPVQQPLLPPGQYPPGQYPPAQQQGQWQQQQPPYGCAYPPPYMPAYPANPQQSPPPGYAASGYPLPPPGYYPPGSQGPAYELRFTSVDQDYKRSRRVIE